MKRLILKPGEEKRLLRGHLWAYRNEFESMADLQDGELVDVFAEKGRFVGRGFFQQEGGIAVRLLSRHQEDIAAAFFSRRVRDALAFRNRLYPGDSVYRWVFGESDGLPGFVADRFGHIVSAKSPCTFYETHIEQLAGTFLACEDVEGVRIDVRGAVHRIGRVPATVEIGLHGLKITVDLESGQKTGMFLDQRENCLAAARYSAGLRVLDGHCFIGLWSCLAARAGASHVLAVDSSSQAIELAQRNAAANGLADRCEFQCTDVSEALAQRGPFDIVFLDPPAFAKTPSHRDKALGLYQALNRTAMRALTPGGYLITSNCSHYVSRADFLEVLKRAARGTQREARLIELRGAAPDHPVLLSMPETEYLTCAVLRIM